MSQTTIDLGSKHDFDMLDGEWTTDCRIRNKVLVAYYIIRLTREQYQQFLTVFKGLGCEEDILRIFDSVGLSVELKEEF